ncbi:hypothetical protein D3C76_1007160 [compost metagenome]
MAFRVIVAGFRGVVVVALVVDIIVPSGTADSHTVVLLVRQIHLRQEVNPIGDQTLVEIAVTVVQVGIRSQLLGLPLHTERGVVFDGVVPRQLQVWVAEIQVKRHRRVLCA